MTDAERQDSRKAMAYDLKLLFKEKMSDEEYEKAEAIIDAYIAGGANMTDKESVSVAIEHFGALQRIKQANGSQDNPVLDHELKLAAANLSSYGIKVENITLV